jgi:hypothetical protein
MVIYGTSGAKHLRTEALPASTPCPHCSQSNQLRSSIFSRYSHVYWIPFFPIGKLSVTECGSCGQAWDDKALPADLKAPVQALKGETKIPYFHWTGVALLVVGVLAGVFFYAKDERANKAYLQSPQAGDVYTVRAESESDKGKKSYSLLKVRSVSGNSVEVVSNEYQIEGNSHPLKELNKPENYSKDPTYLTRYDLQLMQQKGELTDVDRP